MITHKLTTRFKSHISSREAEILELISLEYTINEIAKLLFLSPHTIVTHRKNMMRKLDVRNSAGMIRKAFELGILSLDDTAIPKAS